MRTLVYFRAARNPDGSHRGAAVLYSWGVPSLAEVTREDESPEACIERASKKWLHLTGMIVSTGQVPVIPTTRGELTKVIMSARQTERRLEKERICRASIK